MVTLEEAIDLLIQLFPKGRLYDWYNTAADVYGLLAALSDSTLQYGYGFIETLRAEINPFATDQKKTDFEEALGIANTRTAKQGSLAQRRSAIIAKFRESGGFTAHTIKAVLGTLLGYADPTALEVLEGDRSMLKLLHSYGLACDVPIPNGATTTLQIYVKDGGSVSVAGAQLEMNFDASISDFTIELTAPDRTSKQWVQGPDNNWITVPIRLYAPDLSGASCHGLWTLSITNASGSDRTLFSAPWLFVEGIAPWQVTGAANFTWGVYADPAQVTNADYGSADLTAQRLELAHTHGAVLWSKDPHPGVSSGLHSAIPGRCIPNKTL